MNERWTLGGYAPGNYMNRCLKCETVFQGDKRAIYCLPCSAMDAEAELTTLRAEVERLRGALHRISLGSQNSGTTKEDLGREARAASTGAAQ